MRKIKITNYYFIIVFLIIPKFPALVDFTVAKAIGKDEIMDTVLVQLSERSEF